VVAGFSGQRAGVDVDAPSRLRQGGCGVAGQPASGRLVEVVGDLVPKAQWFGSAALQAQCVELAEEFSRGVGSGFGVDGGGERAAEELDVGFADVGEAWDGNFLSV
jgi:hypothetical protein